MPTYEYLCKACGQRLEIVQSFSDAALTTCEACGGDLRKVFSAAGLIFKGAGWHIKDYAAGSTTSGAKPSTGGDGGTSGTSGSSDTGSAKGPDKGPEKGPEKRSETGREKSTGAAASGSTAASSGSSTGTSSGPGPKRPPKTSSTAKD